MSDSDLVARLREEGLGFGIGPALLCQEAAAAIERLTQERDEARSAGDFTVSSRREFDRKLKAADKRAAAEAELDKVADYVEEHWRGAGRKPEASWIINDLRQWSKDHEAELAKAREKNRELNRRLTRAERFEKALRARVDVWERIAGRRNKDPFREGIEYACRYIRREMLQFFQRVDAPATTASEQQDGRTIHES